LCYFVSSPLMTDFELKDLKELLSTPKNIAIIPHRNPDGDAMGSTLGLSLFLNGKGHTTQVIAPNGYPEFLNWLPNNDHVYLFDMHNRQSKTFLESADLVFTLDFNHLSRVGDDMQQTLESLDTTFVMIDHHQSPSDYAKFTFSDVTMSSTCQMVYHFFEMLGAEKDMTKDIATCLYTGILTDTGSFRFRSTSDETHRVAAALIKSGAENQKIHEAIYDTSTPSRLKLLGIALNNMVVLEEFNTAYITMTQKELDDNNFQKGDTEGFVNYCLNLKGIVLAAIFIEKTSESIVKMSLRSKGDFSVNLLARAYFEGGGHTNAAGGKSDLNLEDTVAKFISILPSYKKELTA